jgi:two-component system response regulator NreC
MEGRVVRVLVVDDNDFVRQAICKILKSQDDIDIICEASDGGNALRLVREHKPDVVVLDISMPGGMNGFDAARFIKSELPETKILMLSQFDSPAHKREAIAVGASAYVTKDNASRDLILEFRKIMSGSKGDSDDS